MSRIKLLNRSIIDNRKDKADALEMLTKVVERGSVDLSFINMDAIPAFATSYAERNEVLDAHMELAATVASPNGVLVVFSSMGYAFYDRFSHIGGRHWMLLSEMAWVHANPPASFINARTYYRNVTNMYVLSCGRNHVFNQLGETCKHRLDLVELKRRSIGANVDDMVVDARTVDLIRPRSGAWICNKDYSRSDPADEILRDHVLSWTNPGMLVMDWTAVEGGSVHVCQETNRNVAALFDSDHVTAEESRLCCGEKKADTPQMTLDFND